MYSEDPTRHYTQYYHDHRLEYKYSSQLQDVFSTLVTTVSSLHLRYFATSYIQTFVDDLGRVGGFVRVAYNGATAAGPEFAELQVEIQKIGFEVADLCDASAITVAKFQDASGSILDDFQATYEYLMANETDMALGLFKGIQEVAGEMRKAAEVLQKRFEDEKNKVRQMRATYYYPCSILRSCIWGGGGLGWGN